MYVPHNLMNVISRHFSYLFQNTQLVDKTSSIEMTFQLTLTMSLQLLTSFHYPFSPTRMYDLAHFR